MREKVIRKTVKELAQVVSGSVEGDENLIISGVSGIEEAQEGDITFIANPAYIKFLSSTKASCVLVGKGIDVPNKTIIRVQNPYYAYAKILEVFHPKEILPPGVHQTAIIGENLHLGRDCSILPYVVIGNNVFIGDRVAIYPFTYIGDNSSIGDDTLIHPLVSVLHDVIIGCRVIIHSGAVIGSDGYGFATNEGVHYKIPQVGRVRIEDDVEIGAGVTIDRATTGETVIGRGSKFDNQVQIGHNVQIGQGCLFVAQVGISGSTKIGQYCTFGGQAGAVGHIKIGDGVIAAARAGITKDVPSGKIVAGFPATDHNLWKRRIAGINMLPDLLKTVRELKLKVEELEKEIEQIKSNKVN